MHAELSCKDRDCPPQEFIRSSSGCCMRISYCNGYCNAHARHCAPFAMCVNRPLTLPEFNAVCCLGRSGVAASLLNGCSVSQSHNLRLKICFLIPTKVRSSCYQGRASDQKRFFPEGTDQMAGLSGVILKPAGAALFCFSLLRSCISLAAAACFTMHCVTVPPWGRGILRLHGSSCEKPFTSGREDASRLAHQSSSMPALNGLCFEKSPLSYLVFMSCSCSATNKVTKLLTKQELIKKSFWLFEAQSGGECGVRGQSILTAESYMVSGCARLLPHNKQQPLAFTCVLLLLPSRTLKKNIGGANRMHGRADDNAKLIRLSETRGCVQAISRAVRPQNNQN